MKQMRQIPPMATPKPKKTRRVMEVLMLWSVGTILSASAAVVEAVTEALSLSLIELNSFAIYLLSASLVSKVDCLIKLVISLIRLSWLSMR